MLRSIDQLDGPSLCLSEMAVGYGDIEYVDGDVDGGKCLCIFQKRTVYETRGHN